MPLDACKVDVGFLIFKLPATSSGWSPGVRPQLPVTLWRSQATMCRSPAVRAPGDGERRLLHPANWKYRPRPGIRTSPKPPLSTGVFCEFRCHEAAVRDLTTPAITCRSALKAERQHQTGSCRSSFGTDWAVSALSQVVWVKATPQLAIF